MLKSLEMTEVLDEQHFLSYERAKRGFKVGIAAQTTFIGWCIVLNTAIHPETLLQISNAPEYFPALLKVEAMLAIPTGGMFAILDSIKPTSKLFRRPVEGIDHLLHWNFTAK